MWPFSQKHHSYLGIDIGAAGIKLVELKKFGKGGQLITYGFTDELTPVRAQLKDGQDPTPVIKEQARRLAAVVSAARCQSKIAVASLPVSQVFSAVINIPKVSKKQYLEEIHREVGKLLPFPVADALLDTRHIELTSEEKKKYSGKSEQVLVTAAHKNVVKLYSEIFAQAGLQLDSLETEAFALVRSLVGKSMGVVVVVDIGAERTNFFIIDRGVPRTHRSIELGGRQFDEVLAATLGVSAHDAEKIKMDLTEGADRFLSRDALFDLLKKSLDPIVQEIKYAIDLFSDQNILVAHAPEQIILTGGSAFIPGLDSYLENFFNLRTFIGDPWARVVYPDTLKSALGPLGPRFSVAIGLAERNIV